jgi:hypothetical protein
MTSRKETLVKKEKTTKLRKNYKLSYKITQY